MPAGYVDIHIVTSGKAHHHLAFWHLNKGVTAKRFIRVMKRPNGDPFQVSKAIGGNGPMLAGRLDTTMRLLQGTVVVADIVEGPTTRFAKLSRQRAGGVHSAAGGGRDDRQPQLPVRDAAAVRSARRLPLHQSRLGRARRSHLSARQRQDCGRRRSLDATRRQGPASSGRSLPGRWVARA